jgi:hypothetical protein
MTFISKESLLLRQNLMYRGSAAPSPPDPTYYHLLVNFVADTNEVVFGGGTAITSAGPTDLVIDNRLQFEAISGSLPTAVNGTSTYFVQTLIGTGVLAVASVQGGPALTIGTGAGTYQYTERLPGCVDPLAVWVKHEVATSTGYARTPFTLTDAVYDNATARVGPGTLIATHGSPTASITYNHAVTIFNGGSSVGSTGGGVDLYRNFGDQLISVGNTAQFPINLDAALVDPDTAGIPC